MQGEIRVTVVATGFAKIGQGRVSTPISRISTGTPVIPIDGARTSRPVIGGAYPAAGSSGTGAAPAMRRTPQPERKPAPDVDDLEIPTFIRRQMD